MELAYDGRQVVGMDLHRRRSVLVRMTEDGRRLGTARITNSPAELRAQIARAGKNPRGGAQGNLGLVLGGGTLAAAGAEVHLAHPLGVRAFSYRRVKNDVRDANDLADLLRMGRLAEAWIAPREVRELRELTRYRQKLIALRSNTKDQVHAVLAKLGIPVTHSDLFGTSGRQWLDGLGLPQPYAGKVTSLRQLTGELTTEITMLSDVIADLLAGNRGYQVIQQLPGIGPVLPRSSLPRSATSPGSRPPASCAPGPGSPPSTASPDVKVNRGRVTKQGSRMLRWALVEAVQRNGPGTSAGAVKQAIIARRGKEARSIAKVAAARLIMPTTGLRRLAHESSLTKAHRCGAEPRL